MTFSRTSITCRGNARPRCPSLRQSFRRTSLCVPNQRRAENDAQQGRARGGKRDVVFEERVRIPSGGPGSRLPGETPNGDPSEGDLRIPPDDIVITSCSVSPEFPGSPSSQRPCPHTPAHASCPHTPAHASCTESPDLPIPLPSQPGVPTPAVPRPGPSTGTTVETGVTCPWRTR
ncbi:uncharacterized protein LOC128115934 [Peromyscus californicus insignis]|uniref:uncharacterized protein LOC128115934 n=1 Tax=Peromyscus californicus insignis TaxID=564181 RepID=UPI0022A7EDAD|nr:uncharacterized protein LOC128115934 [Peromyscus californicus insignis]